MVWSAGMALGGDVMDMGFLVRPDAVSKCVVRAKRMRVVGRGDQNPELTRRRSVGTDEPVFAHTRYNRWEENEALKGPAACVAVVGSK